MSNICGNSLRRPALTLLEVLAGLVMLSTLFALILLAHRRHTQQWQSAQRKIAACEAGDRLLTDWFSREDPLPVGDSGQVPGSTTLWWATERVESEQLEAWGTQVVRLSIYDRSTGETEPPLVSIEVVVALEAAGKKQRASSTSARVSASTDPVSVEAMTEGSVTTCEDAYDV